MHSGQRLFYMCVWGVMGYIGNKQSQLAGVWILTVLMFSFGGLPALADDIGAPTIKSGDTWTYTTTHEVNRAGHQTHDEITVTHANTMGITVANKEVGSNMPPKEVLVGNDWSRARSVNGKMTVVNKPMDFPLSTGKKWVVEYDEANPNKMHKNEHWHLQYEVTGKEKITVPAGAFVAITIEAQGEWQAEMAPSVTTTTVSHTDEQGAVAVANANKVTSKTAAGRLYKEFWYVPEVKRFVKSLEEYTDQRGSD